MARTYTDDEKQAALDLYLEVGACETARRTSIPVGTITSWAKRTGVQSEATEKTLAAVTAAQAVRQAKVEETVDGLLDDIAQFRAQLFAPCVERRVVTLSGGLHSEGSWEVVDVEREQPTFADQKAIVTTMAIAIDKVQLLTGEATERVETTEDVRTRASRILDELAEKRAQRAS